MSFIKNNRILFLCGSIVLVCCTTLAIVLMKHEEPVIKEPEATDKICLEVNMVEENTMKLNPIDAFEDMELTNVVIEGDQIYADVTFHINLQYLAWNAKGIFENRYSFEVYIGDEEETDTVYTIHITNESVLPISINESVSEDWLIAIQDDTQTEIPVHIVFRDVKEGYQRDFYILSDEIEWI